MGEEVKMTDYDNYGGGCDEERVLEWEDGLPTTEDLTPLTQPLIPPELASAFSITPEPCRSMLDVTRASESTFSSLRGSNSQGFSSNNFKSFNEDRSRDKSSDPMVVEGDDTDRDGSAQDSRKLRKINSPEEADSAARVDNSGEDPSAKTLKRPRLVWTPQLHKRFVDVVGHLGIKNAVPKTIMQMMNVEGLTRENVASHLQKYRLYLKRMQGLSNEGTTSSDQLFSSTHESAASHSKGHVGMPIPMPYGAPAGMMPMPVYGHGHMGMPVGHPGGPGGYHGFDSYNMMQQRDWSGNKYGSIVPYPPRVTPNDK